MRIKHNLLSESVYDLLQRLIYEGVYQPGQRLLEADLAKQFDTSQAPIREAFRRLEENWIVERVPRRGTCVRTLLRQDMEDLLRIRAAYDEVVIRRAMPHLSANDVAQMEALVQLMGRHVQERDVAALARADMDFHSTIWNATGSSLLCSMSFSMYGAFMLGVTTISHKSWDYAIGTAERHEPIVRAIMRRDADAAVQANWQHMQHTIEYMALSNDASGVVAAQRPAGAGDGGAEPEQ